MSKLNDVIDHPLFLRLFGWLMSEESVRRRMLRRSLRRAARRRRRRADEEVRVGKP